MEITHWTQEPDSEVAEHGPIALDSALGKIRSLPLLETTDVQGEACPLEVGFRDEAGDNVMVSCRKEAGSYVFFISLDLAAGVNRVVTGKKEKATQGDAEKVVQLFFQNDKVGLLSCIDWDEPPLRFKEMRLELIAERSVRSVDNPSPEQIEEALKPFQSLPEPELLAAILFQKDESYFIQTIFLEPNGGFELEFKEGSDDKMYHCTNAPLSLAVVVRTFQRYAKGDERWKTELEWEKLEIPPIYREGVSAMASQKSTLLDVAGSIGVFVAPVRSELVTVRTTPEIKRRLEGLAREHDWTVSHAVHVILSLGLAALDAGGVRGQDEQK